MQSNTFLGLFVGQNIITLKCIDSTNNYLKELLSKSKPVPEGTVILAEEQSAGRGQMGNVWHSEAGKNLTFSIVLNPTFLPIDQQFKLNRAVSLALNDVLARYFGDSAKIKWPNDSYIGTHKIGGMLIENSIQNNSLKHAVIGIGLNVNQSQFSSVLKNVTSFVKILNQEHQLTSLLTEICKAIEVRYLQLKAGKYQQMEVDYLNKLYKLNEWSLYRIDGQITSGKIKGVSADGHLEVEVDHQVKQYGLKEIEFI